MSGTRSWRWLALAAALVAIGLAARVRWRRPSPARPAPSAESVRQRPALQASLSLSVLDCRRVEVLPGTPLLFEASLSSGRGAAASTLGSSTRPWHSLIRLAGEGGKPLPWTAVPLGQPRSVAFGTGEGGRPTLAQSSADVAVLDHKHTHRLFLAAAPEAMSGVAPGTYRVRAVVEGETRLESAPVTVVVREPGSTSDRDRLEEDRLAWSAQFYVWAKRYEEARRSCEDLTRRKPKDPGAWMLLGDALDGLDKPREALVAYQRALAVSPRSYEEPAALYERMVKTSEKLKR